MAKTGFSTDAPQTVEIWAAMLFREAQDQTFLKQFLGKGSMAMVDEKTELGKDKGDTIHFDLLKNLTGEGITGDTDIEDNEEQLVYKQDSLIIQLRGSGIRAAGKMSLKRTKHSIKEDGRSVLAFWLAQIMDNDWVLAMSGQANNAGQTSPLEPTKLTTKWVGGQTSGGSFNKTTNDLDSEISTATDSLFGTLVISAVKRRAQLLDPKIRPLIIDGKPHYVMFIHPYQAKALRAETAWIAAQRDAGTRGNTSNPLFTGMIGMWEGVVIHEWEKVITRLGAGGVTATEYFDALGDSGGTAPDAFANTINGARALFCGAQSSVLAWGQQPGWYEKDFDYGRVPGIATDVIYGVKKTVFDSRDFGMISVDTAIVPD